MAKTRMTIAKETAEQAFDRNLKEAIRRVDLLATAIKARQYLDSPHPQRRPADLNWGDVGDLSEVNVSLARALNAAGVEEFVEK